MGQIFSLHYYQLKASADRQDVVRAFQQAEQQGLFQLPGLVAAHLLWGIKGFRQNRAAALWVYESRQAWEELWGEPENPIEPQDYPEPWVRWERELLGPLLVGDPDKVELTSYQELFSFAATPESDLE